MRTKNKQYKMGEVLVSDGRWCIQVMIAIWFGGEGCLGASRSGEIRM